MRKVLARIALIFLFLLLLNTQGFSSHMLGGELTWVCQGNGSYKFRAGMYLDCNGIGIGSPLFVNSNSPAGQITLNLVQVIELSSAGFFPDGTSPCADCTSGSPGNPTLGLVAYYIFESGDIILNGVPPATGWYFYTGQSTRTPGITNVVGSSLNFAVVAYMYPTSGQSAYPCFDSSPQFESPPVSMVCNSQPYAFHAKASDPEADLLTFEWAEPLVYLNAPLPFAPGYSVNSPFPSPSVSPGSVAATLDTATGLITGISDLSGKFLTSTKVSSYKCGQKVAEVYRDFTYTFTPACSPMINGTTNVPPAISAPFIDPVTGLQTAYSDTVSPGDTVQFILQITDYNFYLNGTPQKVIVAAAGGQFGANFVIPQTGCPNPPCATLTSTVPDTFLIAGAMGFNWITECAHASSPSAGCGGNTTTYHFVAEAHDNYCPANAYSVVPFSITVIGAVISVPLSQTVMCSSDPPLVLNAWPPGGVWSGAVAANVFDPSVAGPGSHTVYYTFTDSSGCISTDQINLTVNVCTGIGEPEFSDGMDFYPNPVIDELMLPELVHPISLLNIFNTQGSKMLQFTEDDRTSYPVTGLAPGMYFYEVIFEDGHRGTGKFVKR